MLTTTKRNKEIVLNRIDSFYVNAECVILGTKLFAYQYTPLKKGFATIEKRSQQQFCAF